MNENENHVYGLLKLSRSVARRARRNRDAIEFPPPRPPMRLTAEIIPMPVPTDPPEEKRPLAA